MFHGLDEEGVARRLPAEPSFVTTFYRPAHSPRVWADFAAIRTVHLSKQGFVHDTSSSGEMGTLRISGFVDRESTSGPLMSKRFAERLGYDFSYLGRSKCVSIHEIQPRPGGWGAVCFREHRTEYQGIGCIWVDMNLAREGQAPRRVKVRILIFEDGTMPARTSVEFVLNSTLANAFGE